MENSGGTRVVVVDAVNPDPILLEEAAQLIRGGSIVAFPTETVYGLGANALDESAVLRIYEAKGRPAWNPVIVHVASAADARSLAASWPLSAERLAASFWPGPLTLVLPRAASIPDVVTAGGETVGLRVPAHAVARALIKAAGCPIAAPSANRFTQVSPTTASHVVASLGERVALVIDAGPCAVGIESTVVECGEAAVTILRPGMIDQPALEAALAGVVPVRRVQEALKAASTGHSASPATDPSASPSEDISDGLSGGLSVGLSGGLSHAPAPRSPGMALRHYAPRAEVWLFKPTDAVEIAEAVRRKNSDPALQDSTVAMLRTVHFEDSAITEMRMPVTPTAYARRIYAALHEADERGATLVVIEMPPDEPAWAALRDRLFRSSH